MSTDRETSPRWKLTDIYYNALYPLKAEFVQKHERLFIQQRKELS